MIERVLLSVGLAAFMVVGVAGCGGKPPEESTRAQPRRSAPQMTAVMGKPGASFRAQWTWSSSSPGTARATVTVTPTMAGQSLTIRARLPDGVVLAGGELDRALGSPAASVQVGLEFQIGFAVNLAPMIPVEILLVVNEEQRSAATIVIHDPSVAVPEPEEAPGTKTSIGGFPAKVVGQAEPQRR